MAQAAILKDLITALGLETPYQLEQEIKVSNSRISKAINRNSRITGDIILAILNRYPNVSRQWLETGSGSMFTDGKTEGNDKNEMDTQQGMYQMTAEEARQAAEAMRQMRGKPGRLNTRSSFEDVINAVNRMMDEIDELKSKKKE